MSDTITTPVFVSSDAARTVFRWQDAILALRTAYSRPMTKSAVPPRTIAREGKAWLRILPAIPPGGRYFGAKLMGMDAGSTFRGVEYIIVLFDRQTSRIAVVLDAHQITAFRTAATSATALDRLAPVGSSRLAVLGSGLEASMHTRAFATVRPLLDIKVFSPLLEHRSAFATACQRELGIPTDAVATPDQAVEGADVVLAAARSRGELPILYGSWLKSRCTVISIGSTVAQQREIDVSVVERSELIVCDALEEVLEQTGDMIAAGAAGLAFRDKAFSLTDLISGACDQRLRSANVRMFKSVGDGVQDIVIAELIASKAIERGLAMPLAITFEAKH